MEIEITIERLGAKGDGVGSHGGQEVFAAYTVPGERVSGRLHANRLEAPRILVPVSDRIKAPCRHFRTCGGCTTQHIANSMLADWKREIVIEALKKSGLTTDVRKTITSSPRSRRRAVFTGKRTKHGAILGFHARGSAAVVPIESCSLLHGDIEAGFEGLRELVKLAASRKSQVRVFVATSLGGLDVDVSGARAMDREIQRGAVKLVHDFGLARLFWNGEIVLERMPAAQAFGDVAVIPPNGAFFQATLEGETALRTAVLEITAGAGVVVDLFTGCGTFALPLAKTAEVTAVDSSAPMLDALNKAWRHTKGLKRVETITRDLFQNPLRPDELNKFDAIVIDPPRAGAKAQSEQIALSDVKTAAFVSCNPATFARDAKSLVDANYTLEWVQVIDQFLWSGHCELVAKFTRR